MAKKVHILKDKGPEKKYGLGISSTCSIFQIILELNKITDLELKITTPASNPKKKETYTYPHGSSSMDAEAVLHIFKNKLNGQILFIGLASFDYIFVFDGENAQILFQEINGKLKEIPDITLSTKLELKQLKNLKDIFLSIN